MNKSANINTFSGKVAVVTGGAGDIGLATAQHLGELGAEIALVDIDEDKLDKAITQFQSLNIKSVAVRCDITDQAQVRAALDQIIADLGTVDLLFNNVGYQGDFTPTHQYSVDDFQRVMNINVNGAFTVLRIFTEHMASHGGGSVVNTASMAAVGGPPNMIAYTTSKAALLGMTLTAAKDLAPYNIRVNAISPAYMGPGFMWTRQIELQAAAGSQYFDKDPAVVEQQMIGSIPMRRYGEINEIPGTVAFLLSNQSSYITGINVPIAGGIG